MPNNLKPCTAPIESCDILLLNINKRFLRIEKHFKISKANTGLTSSSKFSVLLLDVTKPVSDTKIKLM